MSIIPRPPIRRRRDGSYDVSLSDNEREALTHFLDQLRELVLTDDPVLRRLYPAAYVDDADRENEYRELMRGDLIEANFAAIDTMEETLAAKTLTEAQLDRWMHAINALRLVIGTRLDVGEDVRASDVPDDDPDAALYQFYEYLAFLLTFIVEARTHSL